MRICGRLGYFSEKVNIRLGESQGDDGQETEAEGRKSFMTRRKFSRSGLSFGGKVISCPIPLRTLQKAVKVT
jgi:hypothetical protein